MDNTLTQWISEDTRFSNEEETSRLDLAFSKELEGIEDVNIGCPVAKSDHATLKFNVVEEVCMCDTRRGRMCSLSLCLVSDIFMSLHCDLKFYHGRTWMGQ